MWTCPRPLVLRPAYNGDDSWDDVADAVTPPDRSSRDWWVLSYSRRDRNLPAALVTAIQPVMRFLHIHQATGNSRDPIHTGHAPTLGLRRPHLQEGTLRPHEASGLLDSRARIKQRALRLWRNLERTAQDTIYTVDIVFLTSKPKSSSKYTGSEVRRTHCQVEYMHRWPQRSPSWPSSGILSLNRHESDLWETPLVERSHHVHSERWHRLLRQEAPWKAFSWFHSGRCYPLRQGTAAPCDHGLLPRHQIAKNSCRTPSTLDEPFKLPPPCWTCWLWSYRPPRCFVKALLLLLAVSSWQKF